MPPDNVFVVKQVLEKNHLPDTLAITRFQSGIVSNVYSVGSSYVVKIADKFDGVFAHQKEVTDTLIAIGAKVPKVIDSGDVDGKPYLLIEKLRGINLVYDWLGFTMKQKENFVSQIAEQLKKFHSLKFNEYAISMSSGKTFSNLKDAVDRITKFSLIAKNKLDTGQRNDVELLEKFYYDHVSLLDETGTAVLVHNDLNLENIFYENDEITGIIDFDWVSQAPKDYELWKIVEVFRDPKYTVEERLESLYDGYRMVKEFGFLGKHYPTLFQMPNLTDRIRLYYLEKLIERVNSYQSEKHDQGAMKIFREEIQDLFKTDWLDELIAQ